MKNKDNSQVPLDVALADLSELFNNSQYKPSPEDIINVLRTEHISISNEYASRIVESFPNIPLEIRTVFSNYGLDASKVYNAAIDANIVKKLESMVTDKGFDTVEDGEIVLLSKKVAQDKKIKLWYNIRTAELDVIIDFEKAEFNLESAVNLAGKEMKGLESVCLFIKEVRSNEYIGKISDYNRAYDIVREYFKQVVEELAIGPVKLKDIAKAREFRRLPKLLHDDTTKTIALVTKDELMSVLLSEGDSTSVLTKISLKDDSADDWLKAKEGLLTYSGQLDNILLLSKQNNSKKRG